MDQMASWILTKDPYRAHVMDMIQEMMGVDLPTQLCDNDLIEQR
jgi:hypothetical protein